ncbi:MAG TPA: hypothetical protein VGH37_07065 [Candidatus Acidoferrum sp.]
MTLLEALREELGLTGPKKSCDRGTSGGVGASDSLRHLVERIEFADQVGLDVFGVGEHHRREFLDSAPAVILAAAADDSSFSRYLNGVCKVEA